MMSQGQAKHFMQDAIEKKIEKFSSQNVNVQKRVNTSSKFRNNTHMMLGSLNKSQISSKHGPGTSGGNGQSSGGLGPISKKKYSVGSSHLNNTDLTSFSGGNDQEAMSFQGANLANPNESFNGSTMNQLGQQVGPINLKYQLMKNQTLNPSKLNSHMQRNSKA